VPGHEVKELADLKREGSFDERRRPEREHAANYPHYHTGDQVLITGENAFGGFAGCVRSDSRQSVQILVSMFGRLTPTIISINDVK
jgi:transcription antitermination factor NusG